jgi:Ca-activated chloride channel family protein
VKSLFVLSVAIVVALGGSEPAGAFDPLQSARRAAASGQRSLAEGDTLGAIRDLMRAQALAPEDEEIRMGLGEALYEATEYESARRQFESIAAERPENWGRPALYNAGNAAFDAGDLESALDLYTRAVLAGEADPPEDLVYNLELAQQLLERQQQQQQQQEQSGGDESQDQQQDPQEGDESPEDDQQQDQGQDQQQQQDDQQSSEQQEQQPPPEPQSEPEAGDEEAPEPAGEEEAQMTQEEAMRLLQALDADEEELRKSIQRRLRGDQAETDHDW